MRSYGGQPANITSRRRRLISVAATVAALLLVAHTAWQHTAHPNNAVRESKLLRLGDAARAALGLVDAKDEVEDDDAPEDTLSMAATLDIRRPISAVNRTVSFIAEIPSAGLPSYAQLPYHGPITLGGTPDPGELDWLLATLPQRDLQIRRDLAPWRKASISMSDIIAQREDRAALTLDNSTMVWGQPTRVFTVVVWENKPYLLQTEAAYIMQSFIPG